MLEQQKGTDNDIGINQFSLLVKRFSESTKDITENRSPGIQATVKAKHNKGYLKKWLGEKNILVSGSLENLRADEYLFKTVDFLAEHYHQLSDFFHQLKLHQNNKKNFTYKAGSQSIQYIRQWCTLLKEKKIIDTFNEREDQQIFSSYTKRRWFYCCSSSETYWYDYTFWNRA